MILMSSGASVRPTASDFEAALSETCHDLARQLLADAEGAAHTIAIEVRHAASEEDAVQVGRAIARSNLFKCAVFGQDPNWGRVLAAIGTTPPTSSRTASTSHSTASRSAETAPSAILGNSST